MLSLANVMKHLDASLQLALLVDAISCSLVTIARQCDPQQTGSKDRQTGEHRSVPAVVSNSEHSQHIGMHSVVI